MVAAYDDVATNITVDKKAALFMAGKRIAIHAPVCLNLQKRTRPVRFAEIPSLIKLKLSFP